MTDPLRHSAVWQQLTRLSSLPKTPITPRLKRQQLWVALQIVVHQVTRHVAELPCGRKVRDGRWRVFNLTDDVVLGGGCNLDRRGDDVHPRVLHPWDRGERLHRDLIEPGVHLVSDIDAVSAGRQVGLSTQDDLLTAAGHV